MRVKDSERDRESGRGGDSEISRDKRNRYREKRIEIERKR